MHLFFAFPFSSGLVEILCLVFWIWCIYTCATTERNPTERALWLLLIILVPLLGPLLYFLIRVAKVGR